MGVSSAAHAHRCADPDGLVLDCDPARLDIDLIHGWLTAESYWVPGISRLDVECAIRHSLNFGAYRDDHQLGFARVVTDYVGFAWVCDVFVVPAAQGLGIGKRLARFMRTHPDLQNLRRWILATRDAHGLYAQFGFTALAQPARYMECLDPGAVQRRASLPAPTE